MNPITLKQLRYLDALARHRHFGLAAEACAISQPALSMQIRELEDSLGGALVERGARPLRLTGLGEEIAARARDILRAADELAEVARARRDGPGGRLRLGVIPTIAPYLLPRLIRDLAARYPGLELQVRETQTERLIAELTDGRLDTALLALPVSEPGLEEVALFSETFVLVRPEAEAAAPVPSPEALPDMQLLLLEEGHCFRDQALAVCGLRAGAPRAGLDGSSLSTLVQMVGAGIGVTLIPEMAVGVETRGAPVAVQRFAAGRPARTVGMLWRRKSPLARELREVAELVRQSAEAMYAAASA
ncbi:hydrogen peroxide-inducible genes activator [Roseicyclus persicicus]|uniref:LysR family transcriptional regulator n=1 Tax=Roseicyclus persicicus TaxID=2650661 RepID=A0A7X6JWK2_9RHOB|nr:hydrogen peroxide-inducible genes activator [Roseibacterium persicicum]NKX43785.1 LysR family transcriptional regulator [Roseibacterium persicicum]